MCKVKISCVDQFEASTSTPPLPLGILTYEDCFVQIPNLIIPFHFPTSAVQGQPSNAKGLPNRDRDVEAPN